MKIIGITGPSGSGKGVCCEYFCSLGIPCIDTDRVYHDLLLPPSKCAQELVARFGKEILRNDETVDRTKLATIVFSDTSGASLSDLNAIAHKFVKEKTLALLDEFQQQGKIAAVVDAPLLFEAEFDKFCDFTIAVLADRKTRLERIIKRDALSHEKAEARLAAQKEDAFYIEKADHILYNDGNTQDLNTILASTLTKESVSKKTQIKKRRSK